MINCTFEHGSQTNLRHVTCDAIIVKAGKVLLEKRGSFKGKKLLESGKWALIGGFLDLNETIVQGIKREIKEEIGIEVDSLELFRIVNHPDRPNEDRQNVTFVFVTEDIKGDPKADGEEVSELKWFELENLPDPKDMAFDHLESIELYKKFLKENHNLPIY
jgi:ADP-ribose pyrophosphatase YjhB (NUDIX family)